MAEDVKKNSFIYGLDEFKFNDVALGYISEDGLEWAGDKPEKVKINAAQVQSGPVKVITKGLGTNTITFKLIELDGKNCEGVLGGTYKNGEYTPPSSVEDKVGKVEIECTSGHVITIPNANLSAKPAGKISGGELFSIDCEVEILATENVAPYTITDPETGVEGA